MAEQEIKTIDSFVDVGNIFESTGFSIIRITKNGKPENMRIPIKTGGVDELRRRLGKEAPLPPVITETIEADSPEGVEMGIEEDQLQRIFDYTDKEYGEKMEKHIERVVWALVIQGLRVKWPEGCDSYGKRKNIMLSKGITHNQVEKLFKDIEALTKSQEDREDFLPGNLSDSHQTLKKE